MIWHFCCFKNVFHVLHIPFRLRMLLLKKPPPSRTCKHLPHLQGWPASKPLTSLEMRPMRSSLHSPEAWLGIPVQGEPKQPFLNQGLPEAL